MTALADRLAARTLELVDIPSESGNEDAIRERLLSLVPPSLGSDYGEDGAFLFSNAPPGGVVTGSRSSARSGKRGASSSSRDRRGRTSRTSRRTGSTRSTSARGHTAYAHRKDELVRIPPLVHAHGVLHSFLTGRVREDVTTWT